MRGISTGVLRFCLKYQTIKFMLNSQKEENHQLCPGIDVPRLVHKLLAQNERVHLAQLIGLPLSEGEPLQQGADVVHQHLQLIQVTFPDLFEIL
jgi:hypothetical protein